MASFANRLRCSIEWLCNRLKGRAARSYQHTAHYTALYFHLAIFILATYISITRCVFFPLFSSFAFAHQRLFIVRGNDDEEGGFSSRKSRREREREGKKAGACFEYPSVTSQTFVQQSREGKHIESRREERPNERKRVNKETERERENEKPSLSSSHSFYWYGDNLGSSRWRLHIDKYNRAYDLLSQLLLAFPSASSSGIICRREGNKKTIVNHAMETNRCIVFNDLYTHEE